LGERFAGEAGKIASIVAINPALNEICIKGMLIGEHLQLLRHLLGSWTKKWDSLKDKNKFIHILRIFDERKIICRMLFVLLFRVKNDTQIIGS
jgi:hypothetical protein